MNNPAYVVELPAVAIGLTNAFAARTKSARSMGIDPYLAVGDVIETLAADEAKGMQLAFRGEEGLKSQPFSSLARDIYLSPHFRALNESGVQTCRVSTGQAQMLARVRDGLNARLNLPQPLQAGEAYLLSVVFLNELHDRRLTQVHTGNGEYRVTEYSEKQGLVPRAFLLG